MSWSVCDFVRFRRLAVLSACMNICSCMCQHWQIDGPRVYIAIWLAWLCVGARIFASHIKWVRRCIYTYFSSMPDRIEGGRRTTVLSVRGALSMSKLMRRCKRECVGHKEADSMDTLRWFQLCGKYYVRSSPKSSILGFPLLSQLMPNLGSMRPEHSIEFVWHLINVIIVFYDPNMV